MVSGKVRMAMSLKNSPAKRKQESSPPPPLPESPASSHKSIFSRSFGVYFPRASAQVQPRPSDSNVNELIRLVEELRERESLLKTELLELKLLKECVSVIPALESEISGKSVALDLALKKVETLEKENEKLRVELVEIKGKSELQRRENEVKLKRMEAELIQMKKMSADRNGTEMIINNENEDQYHSLSSSSQRLHGLMEVTVKPNLNKILKRNERARSKESFVSNLEVYKGNGGSTVGRSSTSSNSSSDSKRDEAENERLGHSRCNSEELADSTLPLIRSRAPRVPKPPPKPSPMSNSTSTSSSGSCETRETKRASSIDTLIPPPPPPPKLVTSRHGINKTAPPPPPPPTKTSTTGIAKVRKVPEVVEFYHSLMGRDSRKDSTGAGAADWLPATTNARDMIGEIENRSTHLMAIKTDVELQVDFIGVLIKEVENAAFTDIEDVVLFVKWLDEELSYLVDERAVLKHFNWPEQKADTLREAAFGYCDIKKLEFEASSFCYDGHQPCGPALKKMLALLEKLEHGMYNISRMRESAAKRYKGFQIPVDWMLETGTVSQIKLASVKLAMKYMKRVSAELETTGRNGPDEEKLILQSVRFAFRVHQFAGGFDMETMKAFQELRDRAKLCHVQWQNTQKIICKSTSC